MKSKMISVVVSIFATTALIAETVTVEKPAGYGVNTLTQDIDLETGNIVSENPEVEKVTAYRIHLYRNTDGREVAYVVGVDGVERPVVLIDPLEYRLLTERLDAVWQSFHATVDGRRKLHGKLERTEINEKARQKVEIYADGFRHTETLPEKRKPTEVKIKRLQAKKEEKKPKGMSDKRWEMRKAFEKHRMGVGKTITVEHDAVTGKETILEGK